MYGVLLGKMCQLKILKNIYVLKKLTTKGNNSAFSVGVPPNLVETVYNPDFWPENIALSVFKVNNYF